MIADSAETAFCAFTSAATLADVGLNSWVGWWWADPPQRGSSPLSRSKEGIEAWHDADS